jgi:hypothetical protein
MGDPLERGFDAEAFKPEVVPARIRREELRFERLSITLALGGF